LATLANLIVQMSCNTAALEKSFKQAQDKAHGFGAAMSTVGKIAGGIIVAQGLQKLPGILTSGIDAAQSLAASISKLGRETGLTAEESSKLLFAFKHYGLDAADASKSLGILAKKLKGVQDEETGVTTGGKSTAAILADLGIKAVDATGHLAAMGVILPQVADVFKSMPDGIEKTGLAMQLFGRSGKDMIPVLNQGSEGLKALGLDAEKLGVAMDQKSVQAAKNLTFAERDLHEATTGLKISIGTALIPAVTTLTTRFTGALVSLRPLIKEGLEKAGDWLTAHKQDFIEFGNSLLEVGKGALAGGQQLGGLATKILPLLAKALETSSSFLLKHRELIYMVITAWAAWKIAHLITEIASLTVAVKGLSLSFMGPAGWIAAIAAGGVGLALWLSKTHDTIDAMPVLGSLVHGSALYQRELNAALKESTELYERNLITADELKERGIKALADALITLQKEYGENINRQIEFRMAGIQTSEVIGNAAGDLVKRMQTEGASYTQILSALTAAGIDLKTRTVSEALAPMQAKYFEAAADIVRDVGSMIAVHAKAATDIPAAANQMITLSEPSWEAFTKGYDRVKASIEGIMPTVDETFDEWAARLDQMAADSTNFEANLSIVYGKLKEANVQNVDDIVRYIGEKGPEFTRQYKDSMIDQPLAALQASGADMNAIMGTNIEGAIKEVLGYENPMYVAGSTLASKFLAGFWEGFVSLIVTVARNIADTIFGTLQDAMGASSPAKKMIPLGVMAAQGYAQGWQGALALPMPTPPSFGNLAPSYRSVSAPGGISRGGEAVVPARGSSGGGQEVHYHFDGPLLGDRRQLEAIADRLEPIMRRRLR